jgi:N-acetylglucosamine kinase-like BadF-type ATPase
VAGPPAIVAVDGGNSKTDVLVVAADGTVLGRARVGGSNHQLLGIDGAMASIGAGITTAWSEAGAAPDVSPVAAAGVFCLAGVDLPVDERSVGTAVTERGWASATMVENDTFAVWRAETDAPWGIGVVCGTGLNCAGRGPDGTVVRFPSLGELSGDFAPGGAWLGVRGLGLALRARDGRGEPTVLADTVPAHYGLADPASVLEAVYGGVLGYERLFELAKVVMAAAGGGDGPARAAADALADEVVAMTGAAIRRLGVEDLAVDVVLGGGIFDSGDRVFRARVSDGVHHSAPAAVVRVAAHPPVVGAAVLGIDLLEGVGILTGADAEAARAALRGGGDPAAAPE